MRILFVHNVFPWDPRAGGGQAAHHEIARALAERGDDDVRALFLGPEPVDESRLPYGFVRVEEHPRFLGNVMRLARATRTLAKTWTPHAAYLSSPDSLGVFRGLPQRTGIVMTSHHFEPPHLLDSTAWKRPLRALWELRRLRRFYAERYLLRRAHRTTAVSEYGRRILIDRGYVRDTSMAVHPNGVSRFWFQGPRHRPDADGFLFVGRMDDQKGVDVLLRAMAEVGGDWPLTLVGEGWQRDRYEGLARELGVVGRVQFLGHGDREAVRQHMAESGCMILPSRSENYPLVLLEAMAVGVPVLTTRVGGIPEMIEDGVSGLLVEPGDSAELARAMETVAGDPGLRRRLSEEGRRVADRHSWDVVAGELRVLLEEAAREAGGL